MSFPIIHDYESVLPFRKPELETSKNQLPKKLFTINGLAKNQKYMQKD